MRVTVKCEVWGQHQQVAPESSRSHGGLLKQLPHFNAQRTVTNTHIAHTNKQINKSHIDKKLTDQTQTTFMKCTIQAASVSAFHGVSQLT